MNSCAAIERLGYPVAYMCPSEAGFITPEILEKYITDNTRLVSVMFANNEIGTIQPIRDLCKVAHFHGSFFHTDAVQAVGHIKIDVHELGVDYLSASAHKFNGPKGIGFLYVKKGILLPQYIDGGSQENEKRAGTENIASVVGMAVALKNNCDNIAKNAEYITSLEQQLISEINKSGITYVRNGGQNTVPGLISLSFPGKNGESILHRMDLMGISISTGSACDSVNTEISHVLQAIHLDEILAKGTIRISLGKNNTSDDVMNIADALLKVISK